MFQSFDILRANVYLLVDSDFGTVEVWHHIGTGLSVMALIKEYERRKLPVARNLALYYLWRGTKRHQLHDAYYKPINIAKRNRDSMIGKQTRNALIAAKYYPCILRHIEQLQFGRKR